MQKHLRNTGKRYLKENDLRTYSGLTKREIIECGGVSEFEDVIFSDDLIKYETHEEINGIINIFVRTYED